ncbi:unnamed protein product [Chilo suppressalis]|uniref:Metalloendopeptidase n=1 Tax=Chilo suppressalis TaxID=168631 RepID=A0ABN8L6Y0_CHISP|nr:unnamed protein product [Chilo suppressalis]
MPVTVLLKMFRAVILFCLLAAAAAGPPVVKTRREIEDLKQTLERSREDDGLTLEERMAMRPLQSEWANSGKFEGDMILTDEQIQDLVDGFSSSGRMATTRANSRWPQSTVVYEFGSGEFNLDQQRYILMVMERLSIRTCVRFRTRTSSDRNFVRITGRSDGCYAHVGFHSTLGAHTLNLARSTPGFGCLDFVTVAHEWYHILGFHHMQSTHNRDEYVRIHWENIQDGFAHAFYRYDDTTNLGIPYEYGSCMHYGTHYFSRNGRPTLSTTRQYNGVLGQTDHISGWDILRLQRHYNCPGAWSDEAMTKARTTAIVQAENGHLVEKELDQPPADEFEHLEDFE